MPVVAALIGIIPPVVVAGATIRITKAAIGSPSARKKSRKVKAKYSNNKYSPF